jgi:glycerophosphoryl diester phosphodiesterase
MMGARKRLVLAVVAVALQTICGAGWGIEVIAHRGAHNLAPENTQASAQKCIDLGVDYIEVDTAPSKDGVLYNIHDFTVNRTTNGKGVVASMMSNRIDALDAGSWFGAAFAGERVPRYDTFLPWIKGKIKINFDVKFADLGNLLKLVRDNQIEKDCFFHFASPAMALQFQKLAPDLTIKVDVATPEEAERAATVYGAKIIETGLPSMTPEFREVCRKHNLKIICCAHTNDREEYEKIIASGADMAMVDKADLFLQVRAEKH